MSDPEVLDRQDSKFTGPYDIVVEGLTTGRGTAEIDRVQAYAEAGVTWWLEGLSIYIYETPGRPDPIRQWIDAGPPRVDPS